MTTASPTSTDESKESSDHPAARFQTASEFFDPDEQPETDGGGEGPAFAKGIVWYDQATPIFCCCRCQQHVADLRFEGDRFDVEDYDEQRSEAYRRLMDDAPRCDVCTGDLPEKVSR